MKKLYLFSLLMALLVPWAATAQENLTVADGTITNGYYPIYGYYSDYGFKNEFVYPTDMLDEMTGATINSLTFYSQTASTTYDIPLVIRLKELDDVPTMTSSSTWIASTNDPEVWTGTCTIENGLWEIELDEAYTYEGGNLLIHIESNGSGSIYTSSYFYGINYQQGISGYAYGSASTSSTGPSTSSSFLPKCTFSYIPGGTDICYKPKNLQVSDISQNSAIFSWTPRGEESEWTVYMNGAAVETVTDTFYNFTGLDHSTSYTVGVQAVCSSDNMSGIASTSFSTECGHVDEFPYTFTFEDGNISCWNLSSTNIYVYDGASFAYTGDKFLIFTKSSYSYTNEWAITPQIDVPEDAEGLTMSWAAAGNGTSLPSYPVTYEVLISTTASTDITTGFNVVFTDTLVSSNAYRVSEVDLSDYAGQSITVAFRHTTPAVYSGEYCWLFIDDLAFRTEGWPVARVGRYSQVCGSTDARVNVSEEATFEAWLESGTDDGLNYTWSSAMATAGDATLTDNDNQVSLVYSVAGVDTLTLVAENSVGADEVKLVVNVTEIELATLPFYSNFDTDNDLKRWTMFSLDSTTYSDWQRFTPAYMGDYAVGSYALLDSAQTDEMLVSPAIAVPENVGNMSLIYHAGGFVYDDDTLQHATYDVLVSTNGRSTYQYFTDTIFRDTLNQGEYVDRNLTLNGYAGQTIYIAFRHTSLAAQALLFDEVEIREAAQPVIIADYGQVAYTGENTQYSAVFVEGLSENATYTWTSTKLSANEATEVSNNIDSIFVLNYTTGGFDTIKVVVANAYGQDSTQFTVRVRSLSNMATLPYACDFENEDENANWEIVNGTSTTNSNIWYIGNVAGTTNGLYVSSDNGTTHGYNTNNSSITMAVRMIAFDVATEYAISYDWMANGESNYDFIRVFLAPASADIFNYNSSSISYGSLPTGFIAVDGGNKLNLESTWQTYSGTFNIAEAGTYQLVVCWRNDGGGGSSPAGAFDNLGINALTCPKPQNITISDITTTSATFAWTAGGEETQWQVVVDDNAPVTVTEATYTAEGLEASSAHTVKVYALCSTDDMSFALVDQFRTLCDEVSLPWTDDFESYEASQFPDCWTWYEGYDQYGTRYPYIGTYQYHAGARATYDYITTDFRTSFIATPVFAAEANTLSVSMWVRGYGYTSSYTPMPVPVQFGVLPDMSDTTSFIVVLDTLLNTYNAATSTSEWVEMNFTTEACGIADHAALAVRLRLNDQITTAYLYLDDINVTVAGEVEQYTVSVASTDAAMGTATANHTGLVNAGTSVTATATANQGYQFVNWTDANGSVVSTANPYTFTVNADVELYANFEETTGIDAADATMVRLYPNPATTSVSVYFQGLATVEVIDMNGSQVLSTEADSRATFDVSGMAKGAYFVRVTSTTGTAVSKLVVK